MSKDLINPERALIFRIVHRRNLPDLFANGCRSRNDAANDGYTEIGNQELIAKRKEHPVPHAPGGTLGDYVPFYFTPYSPMLYNIKTGYNDVPKQELSEILILVASLRDLERDGISFVFSDRHAYLKTALFSNSLADLNRIIWPVLQDRNFRKDDLDRFEKYQAEALIHRRMALRHLSGVACYNDAVRDRTIALAESAGIALNITTRTGWYL